MSNIELTEVPTPEQVAQQISAMHDSVWVITSELQKPSLAESDRGSIERNVGHLELMMDKTYITESGSDLSAVTAAIAAGKSALAD